MSTRLIIRRSATFLLVLLWVYAAVSKLLDWDHFKWEMHNQVIPKFLQDSLVYALPVIELCAAGMLFLEKSFLTGLWLSFFLLLSFTIYIGLVVGHQFSYVPCSCGGILTNLGWGAHLAFNLVFIVLTLTIIIICRKGGVVTKMS